jgi:hypothetical protein
LGVADIFVSYTSTDRDWAFWIARALEELGHTPHVHEWEIKAGENIYGWMEKRHDEADHVLCVLSDEYFDRVKAPYSAVERDAAFWQAAGLCLAGRGEAIPDADARRSLPALRIVRHFR